MNLLKNSSLLLLIFVALAFIFPQPAVSMKSLLIPVLVVSMTLSLQGTKIVSIKKDNIKPVLLLIASNFILLSGFFMLSSFFIPNQEFRQGIIALAAVPPAIAVITTAFLLKADTDKALLAEAACYVLSLVLTPLIIWLFFKNQVNIWELVKILLLLIILPFILAKALDWAKKRLGIRHDFKELANLVFGFTFYMGVGLAVDRILASLNSIALLLLILLLSSFGLGVVIVLLARRLGVRKKDLPLYALFGTLKNGNLALGICITLFPVGSYVPVALQGVVHAFYIFFLFRVFKKI